MTTPANSPMMLPAQAEAVRAALAAQHVALHRLCLDSRKVQPGDVFVALSGTRTDGRAYVAQALAAGAAAILVASGSAMPPCDRPVLAVDNLRAVVGELAALICDHPSQKLWLAGITGTNGKTSVCRWLAQALDALSSPCAVIGTLGSGFPDAINPDTAAPLTTPDAISLQETLAALRAQGAQACAMEVSSIGLDQARVQGCHFAAAALTNLTRDHLDYHGDMAAYAAAKARLFAMPHLQVAVINGDDDFGAQQLAELATTRPELRRIACTLGAAPDKHDGAEWLVATDLILDGTGVSFKVRGQQFSAPILGRFNAQNLLLVLGLLLGKGVSLADAAQALRRITPPPGRMQIIHARTVPPLPATSSPLAVVDYAHTPDALMQVLTALRPVAQARGGRLWCVFGCGGDRDTGKRPLMGAGAEKWADRVILTSDNPRSEDPLHILAEIKAGMTTQPVTIPDRAQAIHTALQSAAAEDVVLVAGKGHETTQEIRGTRIPFSDAAEIERYGQNFGGSRQEQAC